MTNLNDTPYNHLIFDNSLTEDSYIHSQARSIAPSTLLAIEDKLPVSAEFSFSPPNSLNLAWTSRSGGDWKAEIYVDRWRGRDLPLLGSHLTFWCYTPELILPEALPLIWIKIWRGPHTPGLRLMHFISNLPEQQWVRVEIPFEAFQNATTTTDFDFTWIEKIVFTQSIDDGVQHNIYIDEIRVEFPAHDIVPPAPTGLVATPYDRHTELCWEPESIDAIKYYVIYRSDNGENFLPVGIQSPIFRRYSDFVSTRDTVYYRISAVGQDYTESAPSAVVPAVTRPLSDDELLDMVQEACFRYYWEGAHPTSGMARESIPGDGDLIALGASGFGILALIVAVERGFVGREEAAEHLTKILRFLEKADRYHGAWSHFMDGRTGRTIPYFGKYDNGGDLVETAFMIQGLLTARQYFNHPDQHEREIRAAINRCWEAVEWSWYRKPGEEDFLVWHWSPDYGFQINHPLIGWNETLIAYLLAIASPTHPIPPSLYERGWASQSERAQFYRQNWGKTTAGDRYTNGHKYFGVPVPVGVGPGGPLFFLHYSFLGFDPRHKKDSFASYEDICRAITRVNYLYCLENPGQFAGYGQNLWGLTASLDHTGYLAHDPTPANDNGTITPSGALASYPYSPQESMDVIKHLYYDLGEKMWGPYGFRDAYNPTANYVSSIFMGLNQAPIVVMIENYRTGLIWDLFMSNPEIQAMLGRIGIEPE